MILKTKYRAGGKIESKDLENKVNKMSNEEKTREQLVEQLEGLRRRVAELEPAEAELLRIKKALVRGAEALRLILENSLDIMALINADGTIRYISPPLERMTGYRPEELTGKYAFDYVHPDDVQGLIRRFNRGMETPGITEREEFRYRHADGSWHTLEATGISLIQDPSVSGVVLTARDITDRKEAEKALQRSERYYRSLIRYAGDMISILNADLTFRWGSRSAGRITGHAPGDIYGRSLLEYIHPDDIEDVKETLDFAMHNPGVTRYLETRFRHSDGSYHFHATIVNNLLDDPSVQGLVINSRDITERKMMEEELLVRNRELNAFAATVSHDLRTPLALIEGYAQLMRAEDTTGEEKEAYLKNIIAASRRMDELTESLLEYAQAGQPGGNAVTVDPAAVINEVLSEHVDVLQWKNMVVEVGEDLPGIVADALKLRQVFANLVDNAIKYMGDNPRPRIEIGAQTNGAKVTFYVRDNGQGIDPDHQEEVFIPFKRFGASASPGLGIGLSTVKRAVKGWGGNIWVESRPGEGSTFYFTAPAAED